MCVCVCLCLLEDAVVDWFHCVLFCRMGGGTGDESIRKIAYFEGARDPILFKGGVSVPYCVCVFCLPCTFVYRCYLF